MLSLSAPTSGMLPIRQRSGRRETCCPFRTAISIHPLLFPTLATPLHVPLALKHLSSLIGVVSYHLAAIATALTDCGWCHRGRSRKYNSFSCADIAWLLCLLSGCIDCLGRPCASATTWFVYKILEATSFRYGIPSHHNRGRK